jgi:hypothetical protein
MVRRAVNRLLHRVVAIRLVRRDDGVCVNDTGLVSVSAACASDQERGEQAHRGSLRPSEPEMK